MINENKNKTIKKNQNHVLRYQRINIFQHASPKLANGKQFKAETLSGNVADFECFDSKEIKVQVRFLVYFLPQYVQNLCNDVNA